MTADFMKNNCYYGVLTEKYRKYFRSWHENTENKSMAIILKEDKVFNWEFRKSVWPVTTHSPHLGKDATSAS